MLGTVKWRIHDSQKIICTLYSRVFVWVKKMKTLRQLYLHRYWDAGNRESQLAIYSPNLRVKMELARLYHIISDGQNGLV